MPSSAWQVDASLEKSGIVVTLEATPSHNFENMVTTEGDRRTRTQKGAAAGQEKEEEETAQQAPSERGKPPSGCRACCVRGRTPGGVSGVRSGDSGNGVRRGTRLWALLWAGHGTVRLFMVRRSNFPRVCEFFSFSVVGEELFRTIAELVIRHWWQTRSLARCSDFICDTCLWLFQGPVKRASGVRTNICILPFERATQRGANFIVAALGSVRMTGFTLRNKT